jgi:hypothetical protein
VLRTIFLLVGAAFGRAGCCAGHCETSEMSYPGAVILGPYGSVAVGAPVSIEGLVSSLRQPADLVQVSWRIDGLTACGGTIVQGDGTVRCEHRFESAGMADIELDVTDSGSSTSASHRLEVVDPPAVAILSPEPGDPIEVGAPVRMIGVVSDPRFAPDLWWAAVEWAVDGRPVCRDAGVDDLGATVCEHVFDEAGPSGIALTVTNVVGHVGADAIVVEVVDPPSEP